MEPNQTNPGPNQNKPAGQNIPITSESVPPVNPEPVVDTQQSPTPPQPANPPKKSIVLIIVAILLLVILGVSGFFVYQKYFVKNNTTVTPSPTPTTSTDPTADWLALSNSNGFTIKYPSNYIVGASAFEPPPPETSRDTIIAPSIEGSTNSIFSKPHIRILALDPGGKTLLQTATENYNANANHPNKPRTITQPKQGVFLDKTSVNYQLESNGFISPADEYLGFDGLYEIRFVEHNNKHFMVYWNPNPTIDQILSTFKFIESSTSSTLNWKTYANSPYRFSFMYPEVVILEDKSVANIAQVILAAQGFREINISARADNQTNFYLDTASAGEITIGSTTWNKYVLPDGYCDGPSCSSPILAVTAVRNGMKYVFSVFVEKGSTDFTDLETQILSSFKFTN